MSMSLDEISQAVSTLYSKVIDPLAEQFAWRDRPTDGEVQGGPLVLIMGNHSSGKSSFINHLLGEEVQKTGLAPTDDGFTIIAHGQQVTRDGAALVGNPKLPFGELRMFGNELISHLKLKRRPSELLKHVTLIDSPGMIDSLGDDGGRGYDFPAVVQWFAEKADVVLFFFDPDKPGTTGETLHVFEKSLNGLDHKLLIVMNKMDRFRSLQDFARAYGALCWNLGKIIPRKDLPLIYTTFTPVKGAPPPTLPAKDFETARKELIAEIRRAPERRIDNVLTKAEDFAGDLRMHARVANAAASKLKAFRRRVWLIAGLAATSLIGVAALSKFAGGPTWLTVGPGVAAAITLGGGIFLARVLTQRERGHLLRSLDTLFETVYARPLLVRDRAQDLRARWAKIRERTQRTATQLDLTKVRKLRAHDLRQLDAVIDAEIPDLRVELHRQN